MRKYSKMDLNTVAVIGTSSTCCSVVMHIDQQHVLLGCHAHSKKHFVECSASVFSVFRFKMHCFETNLDKQIRDDFKNRRHPLTSVAVINIAKRKFSQKPITNF